MTQVLRAHVTGVVGRADSSKFPKEHVKSYLFPAGGVPEKLYPTAHATPHTVPEETSAFPAQDSDERNA
jgi:hypothetical protein